MPAEWEPHAATWIAWPHHEPDWPGKLDAVRWDYAEIVRALHRYEPVEILCSDEEVGESALDHLQAHHVDSAGYRLHTVPTDRVWLRDSAPTGVLRGDGSLEWMNWEFNAWAKYDNYSRDSLVGDAIARVTGHALSRPLRPDGTGRLVLEGGGIEVDGAGTLLVTEEWLLSDVQVRNPGMTRADYERAFAEHLGISRTIWLGEGAVGDDTHGHIDDIARFAPGGTVLLAYEEDPADDNHARSRDNLRRLELAARTDPFNIVRLPFPRPVMMRGERLPASYANFYVCNDAVLVPTFNDAADREALEVIAAAFPGRDVLGIHAVNLVWGLGTLHCLTQQQPAPV
ncbi:MAG TPA: agmatine deiminase family protein [Gemmatimonadaceae bacterium]